MLKIIFIFCLLSLIALNGCKDNIVNNENFDLVYERSGLIDSLAGDCSGVQVRTFSLDTLDLRSKTKIKFNFNSSTDTDVSTLEFYYIENNQIKRIIFLEGDQITTTSVLTVNAPQTNSEIYFKYSLRSSICTGQIFHFKIRDLKIYTY